MKTIQIGNNGNNYPMHQRIVPMGNGGLIEMDLVTENDKTLEVGDIVEKSNYSWRVKEVVETRPAKGNHPHPVTFQRLIVQ